MELPRVEVIKNDEEILMGNKVVIQYFFWFVGNKAVFVNSWLGLESGSNSILVGTGYYLKLNNSYYNYNIITELVTSTDTRLCNNII